MAIFGRPTPEDDARAQAYGNWLRQRNPLALVAFVLGAFSLTHLGALVIDSAAAIVLGTMALRQLRNGESAQPLGHRLAGAAIVLGGISLLIAGVLYARR